MKYLDDELLCQQIWKTDRMKSKFLAYTSNGKLDTNSDSLKHEIIIDKIKQHSEILRENLVEQIDQSLSSLVDELDRIDEPRNNSISQKEKLKSEKLSKEKVFVARSSPLTELLEINHFQTIQHIFVAVLIILYLNKLLEDYFTNETIDLSFELLKWTFGQTSKVILIWVCMKLSTAVLVFTGFQYWAKHRLTSSFPAIWNWSWISFYIIYLCAFFYYPVHYLLFWNLPPASSNIILCEQVRMLMKTHAFVRHNAKKTLSVTSDKDKNNLGPQFSNYLYFLFVPTLVYRDSYPRNANIRWSFVAKNLIQFIGCVFYIYFLASRYYTTVFKDFGSPNSLKNPNQYIMATFHSMLPAAVLYVCNFFGLLQSWFNIFAEILRFADRQFYKDWWNSTSYSSYYRTWNTVVHDWLFTYVYKDMSILLPGNRFVPVWAVFFISAVVHEYILAYTLKFFFPILFIMFGGIGMVLTLLPNIGHRRSGNFFFWFSLMVGFGLILSLYSLEWYARINCNADSYYHVVPRIWICFQK